MLHYKDYSVYLLILIFYINLRMYNALEPIRLFLSYL